MDYKLELPKPSKKELWVENKVEEWLDLLYDEIGNASFTNKTDVDLMDFISISKLEEVLIERAEKLFDREQDDYF